MKWIYVVIEMYTIEFMDKYAVAAASDSKEEALMIARRLIAEGGDDSWTVLAVPVVNWTDEHHRAFMERYRVGGEEDGPFTHFVD